MYVYFNAKIFLEAKIVCHHFCLLIKVIIQIQNCNGVLNRSLMHGTSLLSTPGQFGPALLPYVNKNDDKELAS